MLFWRALTDGAAARRALAEIEARLPRTRPTPAAGMAGARILSLLSPNRRKRLIGLSLLILDGPAARHGRGRGW